MLGELEEIYHAVKYRTFPRYVSIILAVLVTIGILIPEIMLIKNSPYLFVVNADTKEAREDINVILKELRHLP